MVLPLHSVLRFTDATRIKLFECGIFSLLINMLLVFIAAHIPHNVFSLCVLLAYKGNFMLEIVIQYPISDSKSHRPEKTF